MSIDYMLVKHHGAPDITYQNIAPMGDPDTVRAILSSAYPRLDWSTHWLQPSVGMLETESEVIDFHLGYEHKNLDLDELLANENRRPTIEEIVASHHGTGSIMDVAVHYRHGPHFIERMRELCGANGWTLWDLQTGEVFDFDHRETHETHIDATANIVRELHSKPSEELP